MPTMTETDDDLDALDELEPLQPRPRRKLLTPIPLALMAVLLLAAGFIGGVLVQKQSGGSSGGGGFPGAGALAAARPAGTDTNTSTSQGTSGEVSSKKGDVLYVTTSDGTTVKVRLGDATVTRTAEVGRNQIHPGDTVVVQGATQDNGTVKATSVTATAAGVTTSAPFGGGAPTQSPSSSSDPVGQLFGG